VLVSSLRRDTNVQTCLEWELIPVFRTRSPTTPPLADSESPEAESPAETANAEKLAARDLAGKSSVRGDTELSERGIEPTAARGAAFQAFIRPVESALRDSHARLLDGPCASRRYLYSDD